MTETTDQGFDFTDEQVEKAAQKAEDAKIGRAHV